MTRRTVLAAMALVAATLLPATASPAAVTIGNGSSSTASFNLGSYCGPTGLCTGTNLSLTPAQTAAGGLTSPIDGVVVRWRVESGSSGNAVALRVLRQFSGATFTGVGTSSSGTTTGTIDEFSSQVPIKAGDSVGLNIGTSALCGIPEQPERRGLGQPERVSHRPRGRSNSHGGHSGDARAARPGRRRGRLRQRRPRRRTQDHRFSPCQPPAPPDTAAPDTTITKGPQDKTKKKQAIFEFTSTETGSTFECSVDGAGFSPSSRR